RVLEEGLAALPSGAIGQLLAHPELLLELQEHVLSEGGSYWQDLVASSPELDGLAERGWKSLSGAAAKSAAAGSASAVEPRKPAVRHWYNHGAWFALATAASLLM